MLMRHFHHTLVEPWCERWGSSIETYRLQVFRLTGDFDSQSCRRDGVRKQVIAFAAPTLRTMDDDK